MPNVDFLEISECSIVTSEGLKLVGKLTKLKTLICWETSALNDDAFSAFAELVNLEQLDLKATSVTDESIPVILKLQELKKLNLAGTQISEEGFIKLATLPALEEINVANTSIEYGIPDELESKEGLTVIEFEN